MLLRTRGAYMKRIMGLESNQVQIVFKLAARIVMTLVLGSGRGELVYGD